ncbi:MAG: hypothetical protein ACI845_001341 [Gammaproteobacteria bacterium]|jgi:hypothetical protein
MRQLFKTFILFLFVSLAPNAFGGEVSRAIFTIAMDNREPVIRVDSIDSSSFNSISFFTELTDLQGKNITHQWMFEDKVMYEKTFNVKGTRWRVWTSKTFIPEWTGTWTVNVLDEDQSVLSTKSFDYQ